MVKQKSNVNIDSLFAIKNEFYSKMRVIYMCFRISRTELNQSWIWFKFIAMMGLRDLGQDIVILIGRLLFEGKDPKLALYCLIPNVL